MIQINELRVGNKVQDKNGFIFEVVSIFKDGTVYCDFEGNEGDVWEFDKNNPCYGIELTEEILLKCGFVPCSIIENNFNIKGMTIWKLHDSFMEDIRGTELKHLHQLQNLYFALTNKELNVEL